MEQTTIIYTLLGFLVFFLIAIFLRLGSILIQMQNNHNTENAYNNDHLKQRDELLTRQIELLEDIQMDINELKTNVEDMKYVSDIFYKYKLPDRKERELLDQIAIDNEVFDGIANAGKKNT